MSDETTYFTRLDEAECWALLAETEVGRIAFNGPDGLVILPVNYRVIDRAIVFHTRPNTALATLTDGREVAFQVDEIDRDSAIGWSVLIHGTSGPADASVPNRSWLTGEQPVGIALRPDRIDGRVLSGTKKSRS